MLAIVIGLGSMGKRRIRLLRQVQPDMEIVGVDTSPERCLAVQEAYHVACYESLEKVIALGADCAFVCTSPLSHGKIIHTCINCGLHVFTELNLTPELYEENIRLAEKNKRVLFLSSTFLYRKEIQYISSRVRECAAPQNYIYHVGQYLPDWHPWETYRQYFVGDKRTNGCREILAIELPWLLTCFGEVRDITVRKSRNSALNIDYDDNLLIDMNHKNGAKGMLAVDVVSRKAVRRLEVFGEDLYLSWNGTPDTLVDYDIAAKQDKAVQLFDHSEHLSDYASFVIENPYMDEITAFLQQIANPEQPPAWDFARDGEMLKLIDQIGV